MTNYYKYITAVHIKRLTTHPIVEDTWTDHDPCSFLLNCSLTWLQQTFSEADKNGDGTLSIGEVHQLLHKLNVNLPKQKVRQMFQVRLVFTKGWLCKLTYIYWAGSTVKTCLCMCFCIFSNLEGLIFPNWRFIHGFIATKPNSHCVELVTWQLAVL